MNQELPRKSVYSNVSSNNSSHGSGAPDTSQPSPVSSTEPAIVFNHDCDNAAEQISGTGLKIDRAQTSGQSSSACGENEPAGWSRRPLQDLYIAKTEELAKTYFDPSFRLRLLQELEISAQ